MNRHRFVAAACGAALVLPLGGCITVDTPEKPIEINLNVTIRQEVLVRLQQDVDQLIRQNPDAFPETPVPPRPQQ
jgi:YnbE-like lipoprotein